MSSGPKLLAMRPYTITRQLARSVAQLFITRDLDLSSDRFQSAFQSPLNVRFPGRHTRGRDIVNKRVGTVGFDENFIGMHGPIVRAVLEQAARSQKNECQNESDHYVVVQSAARMRPQNVALEGLSEGQISLHCRGLSVEPEAK